MPKNDPIRKYQQPFEGGNLSPSAVSMSMGGGGGSGANADQVDGYHAYLEPTAFSLVPLDIDGQLPLATIPPLTAQFVLLATSAETTNERILTPGDGLDLSDGGVGLAVTLAVDVTDLAGTGLSEDANNNLILPTPGSLSASTANAAAAPHTHEVLANATPGAASWLLKTDSGGSLTLDGGVLRVDAVNNRVGVNKAIPTAPLDVVGNLQLDGDLILVGPQSVYTDSGNLTLKSASDLYLEATGANVRVKSAATLRSDAWVSGMGGTGYGMSYAGALDCRRIYSEELVVDSFTALVSQAHNGSLILTKAVAEVSRDFVVPAVGATGTLYVWDLPGWADVQVFDTNDHVRLRYISRPGGGLVVGDAFGQVTAYANLATGEQSYTFTTRSTTTSGQTVFAGTQALDYGTSGDGLWQATVIHDYAPYTRIQTWSGANPYSGTFTTWVQEGNLEGLSTGWGKGFYTGQNTTNKYLRGSSTGFELHGIAAGWYDASGNRRVWIDPTASGSLQSLLSAGPDSGDKRLDLRADGKLYLKDSIIIGDGTSFAISRAVLHCPLNGPQPYATEYHVHTVGSEGQPGTASNVIGRPGRFAKSAQIAEATTNKVKNPIAGGASSFAAYGGGSITRSTSYYLLGDPAASTHYSFKIITAATGQGASFTLDALTNAIHYATVRKLGVLPAAWQWSLDGSTWVTPVYLGTERGWAVYGYQFTAAQANGKTAWYVKQNGAGSGTFYLDGLQIEAKAYATPVAHGAMPGHSWGGTAHNSGSTRLAATLTFPNIPILAQGSISLWAQSAALMSKHNDWRILADGGGTSGVQLAVTATDSLALYVGGATARASAALTDTNFPAFTFKHIAATWDALANTSTLYLDGLPVGSGTCSALPTDDAGGWDIGCSRSGFVAPAAAESPTALRTFYVATGGNDSADGSIGTPWLTIDASVDKLQAGDLLYIRGGTYNESVTITVSGTEALPITISNYPGETVVIDGEYTRPGGDPWAKDIASPYYWFNYTDLVKVTGDWIVLQKAATGDLEITGSTGRGLNIYGGQHVTVQDVYIHDNRGNGVQVQQGAAARNADYPTLDGCRLARNMDYCRYGRAKTLMGYDPPGRALTWAAAINITGWTQSPTVTNCTCWNNYSEGISVVGCDGVEVTGNTCYDNMNSNIIVDHVTNFLVQDNFVWCGASSPWTNASGKNGIVIGAQTWNPYSALPCNNGEVSNNIVVGASVSVYFMTQEPVELYNIHVHHNTLAFPRSTGNFWIASGVNSRYDKETVIIENNVCIAATTGQQALQGVSLVSWNANSWWPGPPADGAVGVGDLAVNPLLDSGTTFEAAAARTAGAMAASEFLLQAGSPCPTWGATITTEVGPALTEMGESQWPGLLDDLLITDYALSAEEVAILAGAGGPSTFVSDFSLLLTKAGGGQVLGNANGLFGYDAVATPVWALITNEGETWGGEAFSAGDVVLGNPAAANMLWDASAGQLKFRGGSTVQAYLDTDGAITAGAGAVRLDANGLAIAIGTATANQIRWMSGTTTAARIEGSSVGLLYLSALGVGSGNVQMWAFDAAGGPSGFDIVHNGASSKIDAWVNEGIGYSLTPAAMTFDVPLVINRGAALTEPSIDLRADNITHGLTALAASTNTFGELSRASATSGGVRVRGFRESSAGVANYDALELHGWLGEDATTAHTSAARGIIDLYAGQISGGAVADVVANGNVLTVRCRRGGADSVVFIIDEDGDIFYDGAAGAFDDENDALLAMDAAHVLAGEYAKVVEYNQDALVKLGVVHTSGDGRLFVSQKRLTALTLGALGQLYQRLNRLERVV